MWEILIRRISERYGINSSIILQRNQNISRSPCSDAQYARKDFSGYGSSNLVGAFYLNWYPHITHICVKSVVFVFYSLRLNANNGKNVISTKI